MLYLYDDAIVEDLQRSFAPLPTPDGPNTEEPVIKVIDPEHLVDLAAQIQEDKIQFPVISVYRDPDTPIDLERYNFTQIHSGVSSILDTETNEVYYERAIPIKMSYKLTLLTTSTADMDELIRELLHKYMTMYFLVIEVPYECKRKVRFGIKVDVESNIERSSSTSEYLSSGKLHQSIIPLVCEGCVLVTHTPAKLQRQILDTDIQY